MKNLETVTGKSEKEIKALYLSAIDTLIHFGATEDQARKMVQDTMKETIFN